MHFAPYAPGCGAIFDPSDLHTSCRSRYKIIVSDSGTWRQLLGIEAFHYHLDLIMKPCSLVCFAITTGVCLDPGC